MVALNDNLTQVRECRRGNQSLAGHFVSLCLGGERGALPVGRCSPVRPGKLLSAERAADACGNNIIFAGPGAYVALRQEPKSGNALGATTREIQREPIGVAGGINLYEYFGGRAGAEADPACTNSGTVAEKYFCIPASPQFGACFCQRTCTVGKPFFCGTRVTNVTVELAIAGSLGACCEEGRAPCAIFDTPKIQPGAMGFCMTLAVGEVFPFSTTTCICS